jgi:hypothetical protein
VTSRGGSAGPQKSAGACLLASLADPRLGGALPGFCRTQAGLDLDKAQFRCCGATGQRPAATAGTTCACDLAARLASLKRLMRQYCELPGAASDDIPGIVAGASGAGPAGGAGTARFQAGLTRLAQLAAGARGGAAAHGAAGGGKGVAFVRRAGEGSPVWALALAAAWRFGFEPHVVTLGRTPAAALLPAQPRASAAHARPRPVVLLVDGVTRLWQADAADQLEQLVNWAYNAMVPLFIDLEAAADAAPASSVAAGGPRNVRQALTQRIQRLRHASPLVGLRPDCRSKLASVCDGLAAELAAADGGAGATPRPAGGHGVPKLPWDR